MKSNLTCALAFSLVSFACSGTATPSPTTPTPAPTEAAPASKAALETGKCDTEHPKVCESNCASGVRSACFALANMYGDGKGVPKDEARAIEFLGRTCELAPSNKDVEPSDPGLVDAKSACSMAGVAYSGGMGGKKDPAKAIAAWQHGCDQADEAACALLLSHLLGTDGFPKDAGRAAALEPKVCASTPELPACAWLAAMYADGDGVKKDPKKAREMMSRACAKASKAECDALRDLGKNRPK